jgi:pyridoxine 4-dehydrogenase
VLGGVKKIDIFECARVDPKVPVEVSVHALAEPVKEGKIGGIGLSEVGANTIRRAHAVYPIAAVEVELSLFTIDPLTNGTADTCQERLYFPSLSSFSALEEAKPTVTDRVLLSLVGIPLIAYGPVGRGWLTGAFRKLEDLPENDMRRRLPRFQPGAFEQNVKLVEAVEQIAKRKGVIRPVGRCMGSTRVERVLENCQNVALTEQDMEEIQTLLDALPIVGERYGGQHEKLLNV